MFYLIRVIALGFALSVLVACGATPNSIIPVTPLPATDSSGGTTATVTAIPTTEATSTLAPTLPVTPVATLATSTPNSVGLQPGESRTIALATDMAFFPSPQAPVTFTDAPVKITFGEFYQAVSPRLGLVMSDKLVSLDNQQVIIEGYMAPPLKPALDWFVLTKSPLQVCPFCSTDVDWPDEIALVYMPQEDTILSTIRPLRLTGTLHVGRNIDAETGMVSLVRIYADQVEEAN